MLYRLGYNRYLVLGVVTLQCITDRVMSEQLFKSSDACQEMVIEALRYHLLPDRRQTMYSCRTQPRKSYIGQLFAFGADDSGNVKCTGDHST